MTTENQANAYLRTKVLTASPEELRLMLIDGAIKFATQGRDGLEGKDYEAVYNGFSRCRDILIELMSSVREEVDPSLCERVKSLYTFLYNHLLEASHERSVEKADKVIELLQFERETWVMLMEQLTKDRQTAGFDTNTPDDAPENPQPQPRLSIQG